jgi:hypothetical protein
MGDFPIASRINVHEMFYSFLCLGTGYAPHPQIKHEAGVMCRKASKLGCGHIVLAKEFFDSADQHRVPHC